VTGARDVVEYALQRRALLAEVAVGRRPVAEACDAHPYLLLAARHYGDPVPNPCPICEHRHEVLVHYVYGSTLGRISGQAKSVAELTMLDAQIDEFDVYAVEVCPDCGWNHLVRSFVLGHRADEAMTAADG
jgi:hypothetical protein